MLREPFKKVGSRTVYEGRVINVRVDTIEYKEKQINWEIVEMGNAVVIVPVIEPDTFILLYQYRYTAQKFIWEFPAGRAEAGESLEVCAQRELAEECGYRAQRLKQSLSYYPSPGVITEKMYLYFAFDLYEQTDALQDEDEIIETRVINRRQLDQMIRSGQIQDAKTILAFYHYCLHRETLIDGLS
jgi:ADP-ribose pyrophosphatase